MLVRHSCTRRKTTSSICCGTRPTSSETVNSIAKPVRSRTPATYKSRAEDNRSEEALLATTLMKRDITSYVCTIRRWLRAENDRFGFQPDTPGFFYTLLDLILQSKHVGCGRPAAIDDG